MYFEYCIIYFRMRTLTYCEAFYLGFCVNTELAAQYRDIVGSRPSRQLLGESQSFRF